MPSSSDLAFRVLRLEQQLESYQRLHNEELAELHRALEQLTAEVLAWAAAREAARGEGPAQETVAAQAAAEPPGADAKPE